MSTGRLSRVFLLAIILWCAIPLSPNAVDSDFWGHVTYGRDTLRRGLDRTATYTYTARGFRWVNHENLSEIAFATIADGVGVEGLLVLKCLLGCLVLSLVVAHGRRQRVGTLTLATVCVLTAVNLSFYWGLRPHMFTFALFAVLIAWMEWCFTGWSGRWHLPWPKNARTGNATVPARLEGRRLRGLWLCPLLLAIWANTHGGFLAGLAIYLAILGCRGLEYALSRSSDRAKVLTQLSLVAVAGATATLLNPYGLGLHRWLLEALSVPRPEIREWHPPELWTASSIRLWMLLSVAVYGLLCSRRPRDFTRLVVLSLVAYAALQHQRHLPFLTLLIAFWLPTHIDSAVHHTLQRLRGSARSIRLSPQAQTALVYSLLPLCGLLLARVGQRLLEVPVPRDRYPVSALQFMSDQELTGNLVVAGSWAQYVIAVRGARLPGESGVQVAFDGRFRTCYPQDVIDMHFDFFRGDGPPDKRHRSPLSPPADPQRILDFRHPDLVLVDRREPHAVFVIQQRPAEWALLYQDQLSQLWGRATRYDLRASPDYLPVSQRNVTSTAQTGAVPWPAAPQTDSPVQLARTTSLRPTSLPSSPVRHD